MQSRTQLIFLIYDGNMSELSNMTPKNTTDTLKGFSQRARHAPTKKVLAVFAGQDGVVLPVYRKSLPQAMSSVHLSCLTARTRGAPGRFLDVTCCRYLLQVSAAQANLIGRKHHWMYICIT
uniref:Uncharacterized protein n=1 Tax=Anopheles atroparvus TaxID=41427 RepID=A0AAG5DQ39_ANOAO